MLANHLPLIEREHSGVPFIRQHGEERLHVRNLASEIVCHADSVRRIRVHQRPALRRPRQDVVDQHAPVNQIDFLSVRAQRFSIKHQIARVRDLHRHAHLFKPRLQDFKLAPRRHFPPIRDKHLWPLRRSAPVQIGRNQRIQQLRAQGVTVNLKTLGKLLHHRQLAKYLRQRFGVSRTSGRLAVVLRKFQRIRQQERVQP